MDLETRVDTIANNIKALLPLLQRNDISTDLEKIASEKYDWSHRATQIVAAYTHCVQDLKGSST